MNHEFALESLNSEKEWVEQRLLSQAVSIKQEMDYLIKSIEDKKYKGNSLGELQSRGVRLDLLCCQLEEINSHIEIINAAKNKQEVSK